MTRPDWPVLAVYPDGILVGTQGRSAADLMREGTPRAAQLAATTEYIRGVNLGDELDVVWDGRHWWVSQMGRRLGRLTWSAASRGRPDPRTGVPMHQVDDGVLHVHQLFVDADDVVLNCGGYVTPNV